VGSVANSRGLAELLILDGNAGLCGEDGELLGEGRIWIEGVSRLSFAHHGTISMPDSVMLAEIGDLKPSIGRTRRLMRRWSCSMRLLRY
jgi:hypothetical protein